jgi:methylenetetrahydrofolate--tRNA-(uracil-5-)-methyltransferase
MNPVLVIGAGLAGCEAAWQLAALGIPVDLRDMKPAQRIPAHETDMLSELCCSNSFRGEGVCAVGLLKDELRQLGSLIMQCADATRVPAGGALAVDRTGFSQCVTQKIQDNSLIHFSTERVTRMPEKGPCIIATGPLTDGELFSSIQQTLAQSGQLYFFDAVAPLIETASIDRTLCYEASRYGKGDSDDYLNCPMTKEEYLLFWEELRNAQQANTHGFEDSKVFEGCMPVEVMARRGSDTLRYGPMKPVGLRDPSTGKGAYAVLQLRRDNVLDSVRNMVGFQTHLTFAEQKRVFSMIPALHAVSFVRYGVMHRNSFLDSPRLLDASYALKERSDICFAGQMTGVEGYVESCASGLTSAIRLGNHLLGKEIGHFPNTTAIGALSSYISNPSVLNFQPMNINFSLFPPLGELSLSKKERKEHLIQRGQEDLRQWLTQWAMKPKGE